MKTPVSIDDLEVGMFLVGIDQPWYKSPFLVHRFLIKSEEEIAQLRQCGVQTAWIDPTKSRQANGHPPGPDGGDDQRGSMPVPKGLESTTECPERSEEPQAASDPLGESAHGFSPYVSLSTTMAGKSGDGGAKENDHDCGPADSLACDRSNLPETSSVPGVTTRLSGESLAEAKHLLDETTTVVEQVFETVARGGPIDAAETKKVVNRVLDRVFESPGAVFHQVQLQALHRFETNLYTHAVNVCAVSLVLGHVAGFEHEIMESLGIGALLHDAGQMRVPRNLLRKAAILSAKERKLFERHPALGESLLRQCPDMPEEACRIVAEHHEFHDGSGFPQGSRKERISPLSQLVGVVNHYDTLLGDRGGRIPTTAFLAIRELFRLAQGGQLSAKWVERLIRLVGVYPLGSLLEFDTQERGVVVEENPIEKTKPIVKIIQSSLQATPFLVDLALPPERPDQPVRTVSKILDPIKEGLRITDHLPM